MIPWVKCDDCGVRGVDDDMRGYWNGPEYLIVCQDSEACQDRIENRLLAAVGWEEE